MELEVALEDPNQASEVVDLVDLNPASEEVASADLHLALEDHRKFLFNENLQKIFNQKALILQRRRFSNHYTQTCRRRIVSSSLPLFQNYETNLIFLLFTSGGSSGGSSQW